MFKKEKEGGTIWVSKFRSFEREQQYDKTKTET